MPSPPARRLERCRANATRSPRRAVRFLTRAPVTILLLVVGVLWLAPTIGLLVTSLLSPEDFQAHGWWQVFSAPPS